jgi:6,7-dimethyl-8-ribityllumazine synthase
MTNEYHGDLIADSNWKVAIVVSRFNELITSKLAGGAIDCLVRSGVAKKNISTFWVPGAFEIPSTANQLSKKSFDGILCLGAVIRGSTPHFDYVCSESAKGVASTAMNCNIPVIYGIITTDTIEQAIERAGTKSGNKGFDTAQGLVEMISLYKSIEKIK